MKHDHIYPDVPGHRGVATSIEAAEAIAPIINGIRGRVLAMIEAAGRAGMTSEEVADAMHVERWAVRPRTAELRQLRLIGDGGERRRNVTGKRAIVWVAREHLPDAERESLEAARG